MKTEDPELIEKITKKLVLAPISNTHLELATQIAERCLGLRGLDLTYTSINPRKFSIGEFCPKFTLKENETLQGKTVYILAIPGPHKSPEETIERIEMVAFAAKENYADKVVLLTTDLPHARQDRGPDEDPKARGELNTDRMHARAFEAMGIDQVITTHEHSPRISALFALEYGLIPKEWLPEEARNLKPRDLIVPKHVDLNNPKIQALGRTVFKSISTHALLADYLLHHSSLVGSKFLENEGAGLVLKAMDRGNRNFIDQLFAALFLRKVARLYCNKARTAKNDPNAVEVEVIGASDNFDTLDGRIEIFADDGLDTGGTMLKAVEWSEKGNLCAKTGKGYGVPADRLVYFTHPWLGGINHLAVQELLYKKLSAREIITTNTRPYIDYSQYYRFKTKSTVLRLAGLWADSILANELGHDLMSRYSGFKSEQEQHEFLSSLYTLKRHSSHFLLDGGKTEKREIRFLYRND